MKLAPSHPLALSAGLLLVAGIPLGLARKSSPPVVDQPILTIHADSLTTVKISSATNIQSVRTLVGHRASNLDGSSRGRPFQRMAIEGNPFESVWSAARVSGVRLDTGTFEINDVDIALPAEEAWVVGRTYNARQETSGGSHRTE